MQQNLKYMRVKKD